MTSIQKVRSISVWIFIIPFISVNIFRKTFLPSKNLDIAKGTSKVSRANPRYPIIIISTIVNNFLTNHENKKI